MAVIGLDERHAPLAAHRTRITWLKLGALAVGLQRVLAWCRRMGYQGTVTLSQQGATLGQLGVAMAVSEEAEVGVTVRSVQIVPI